MLQFIRGLLALGCIFLTFACSAGKKTVAIPPVPVEVVRVLQQTVPLDIPAIGSAEPLATVQLKPRVLGQITQVHFVEGAVVKQGDLLFSIDPRSFDVAITRAQANLASAQASATNAAEQLQRYSSLTGQGAASKEQFSQYRTTANSTSADVLARQADLDDAKLSREWTEVRSPITGRIGAALYKEGNIVQANTDVLAVINQIQPIHLAFSIPETDLPALREAAMKGSLSVIARDSQSDAELARGSLEFIDNTVDRETGTVTLKARLENEDEKIWPGQFVDIALRLADEKDRLVVPTTAIMDAQNGNQVLIVKNNQVEVRKVEVERTYQNMTVIRSGLQAGETVISSGQLRVSPGAKVAPKEVVPPPPAPALATTPEPVANS